MKFLSSIALLSLLAGCATNKDLRSLRSVEITDSGIAPDDIGKVRTPEIVKAYPVGRYTDPNLPDQMHERHTLYRREQASEWNYRPSKPYALPLGPVVAESNPSSSSYSKTNSEQVNAQQKAHAEALLEQNVALKRRIDELRQKDSTIQNLQSEIERLKKQLESKEGGPLPLGEAKQSPSGDLSSTEALPGDQAITDPGEIIFFSESEADCQSFLISQMRLNDELSAELSILEWRKLQALLRPNFVSRDYLALTTQKTP
jgi:uncharacterized small protein (DUF1192 family)